MRLDEAIVAIDSRTQGRYEEARRVAPALDKESVATVSRWYISALQSLGELAGSGELEVGTIVDQADAKVLIDFADSPYIVRVRDVGDFVLTPELASLLYLASIAHSHLDSIMLLPLALRNQRIEEIAGEASMKPELARQLLASWE